MNTKFGKKEFLIVSLMLFSMFFGAGNFIFPPMVGREAGENFYVAIGFFCITAVALPVLGVAAVARAGTLKDLASRADTIFAICFVTAIYITIGPLLAIPRASNMPFEIAIAPYLDTFLSSYNMGDSGTGKSVVLFIYSILYFLLNYYICINPSKMVETLGKFLTPALLILIVVFFVITYFGSQTNIAQASPRYLHKAASTAFVEGYQTMDAIAALVFGISVVSALKGFGITKPENIAINTIKSGIFAGAILMIVYIMIGFLGYKLGGNFQENIDNGAILLSYISKYLFGDFGRLILGLATFLACLTTTLGLIGSSATYFESVTKIPYKTWVIIWSISSCLIANFGLSNIIKFSVPVLIALYPIAIILIILSLINNFIDSSKIIYRTCVYVVGIIGVINGLDSAGVQIPFITDLIKALPLYEQMLGWIAPACVSFTLSFIVYIITNKKINAD